MSEAPHLLVERDGPLVVLRLNRPAALNALTTEMIERFDAEVRPLAEDRSVRAFLLTGAGRAFCAGGDVGGMSGGERTYESMLAGMRRVHGWVKALRSSDAILVSAVNGAAAGGGFGLALLADVVLAAQGAFFKGGFTALGVAADYGLGWTLPRAVGEIRAAEILFSDRRIPAEEAHRLGFVGRLLPDEGFAEAALAFARQMAAVPFGATLTKRLLRQGEREAFAGYLDAEADAQARAFQSEDFREGVAAFQAKRPAVFRGR